MSETSESFEQRKREHIQYALDVRSQAKESNSRGLLHEALPDLDFQQISLQVASLGRQLKSPYFVSSMTAGHADSVLVNSRLCAAAIRCGWMMGVGSQRRELYDPKARAEWAEIRQKYPEALFFGNIGIAQLIESSPDQIRALAESLGAQGLFVHLNPLQEVLQGEGTPQFKGGLEALRSLTQALDIPVVVKEVGCGIGPQTLRRLSGSGVAAVDVSGLGGTHWGRVEGLRSNPRSPLARAAASFADWGLTTMDCLRMAEVLPLYFELWGSGGVRSGVDAAEMISLGAKRVGIAAPLMRAALESEDKVVEEMMQFELELKMALFCTGSQSPMDLTEKRLK